MFSVLLNDASTAVAALSRETVTPTRINLIQKALRNSRWNSTVRHRDGRFSLVFRLGYWRDFFDQKETCGYPGDHLPVNQGTHNLTSALAPVVGGQYLLNTFPARTPDAHWQLGHHCRQSTPFGFNCGYYYLRLNDLRDTGLWSPQPRHCWRSQDRDRTERLVTRRNAAIPRWSPLAFPLRSRLLPSHLGPLLRTLPEHPDVIDHGQQRDQDREPQRDIAQLLDHRRARRQQ